MLNKGVIPGIFAALEDYFNKTDHELFCDPVGDKGKKQKDDDGWNQPYEISDLLRDAL